MRPLSSLLAVAATLTLACSNASTSPHAGLAAARERWAEHAPASYSMFVSRSCECLPAMSSPALVTVRNGVVESRRYVASGADVPAEYASGYPTVAQMFELIDDAERRGLKPIDVQYSVYGYPTRFVFGDPAVDAPVTFVTDFHQL